MTLYYIIMICLDCMNKKLMKFFRDRSQLLCEILRQYILRAIWLSLARFISVTFPNLNSLSNCLS